MREGKKQSRDRKRERERGKEAIGRGVYKRRVREIEESVSEE